MRVQSTTELHEVDYRRRRDGIAEAYLHRNIESRTEVYEDGTEQTVWEADEVLVMGDYTEQEVAERFAELWAANSPSGVDIETLAEAVEELAAIIAEL